MSPNYDTNHPLVPRDTQERQKAMFLNLAPLLNSFTLFLGTVALVVLWAKYKYRSEYLNTVGKEGLNFQLNIIAVQTVFGLIGAVLSLIPLVGWIISFPFFAIMYLGLALTFILNIVAAVRASEGRPFKYPSLIRLLR